jgi:hypothetical protein
VGVRRGGGVWDCVGEPRIEGFGVRFGFAAGG